MVCKKHLHSTLFIKDSVFTLSQILKNSMTSVYIWVMLAKKICRYYIIKIKLDQMTNTDSEIKK